MLLNESSSGSTNSPEMSSISSPKAYLPHSHASYTALAGEKWRRTNAQNISLFLTLATIFWPSSSYSLMAYRLLVLSHAASSSVRVPESTKHDPPARAARRKKYHIFSSPVPSCRRFIPKNEQAKLSGMKMNATIVSLKMRNMSMKISYFRARRKAYLRTASA